MKMRILVIADDVTPDVEDILERGGRLIPTKISDFHESYKKAYIHNEDLPKDVRFFLNCLKNSDAVIFNLDDSQTIDNHVKWTSIDKNCLSNVMTASVLRSKEMKEQSDIENDYLSQLLDSSQIREGSPILVDRRSLNKYDDLEVLTDSIPIVQKIEN